MPAPTGKQTLNVNFDGTTLQTFTYRPAGEINGVMLNFHGNSRNVEGARDAAIRYADEHGLYVVAPLFDKSNFGGDEYQMGGVESRNGELRPMDERTVGLLDDIAAWAHDNVGTGPGAETIGFGHSAGGQFISRAAAFGPDIFDKIVVGNASTHVRASLSEDLPYGFGSLPAGEREAALRDYLDDPVTIYIGSRDNDPNAPDLSSGSAAMRQGDDRLERAHFVYDEARALAASNGWEFNWELVVADGVSHSASGLLRAPEAREAFDGRVGGSHPPVSGPTPDPDPGPVAGKTYDFDTSGAWDGTVINNYAKGDVFDFRDIDANSSQRGHQSFDFLGVVGSGAFTDDGAQIRVRHYDGDTYVYLNSDGDRYFEAKGMIEGIHDLTASDFLLA